jgi:hypothetical protein
MAATGTLAHRDDARGSAGLCVAILGYESAPALPGDDQPALAENFHGPPDRLVGAAILGREITLAGQLVGELANLDAQRDISRDLHVRKFMLTRIHRLRAHMIKVCTSASSINTS